MQFPEPTTPQPDRTAVLRGYLDYFRAGVVTRVLALDEADRRRSILPSGWTPLELVAHLTMVERRWLVWGFGGADVGDPWADERDGRWHVDPATTTEDVVSQLGVQGDHTTRVLRAHDPDEVGAPGARWDGAAPATLERIGLHLMQEYARHLGQLDVVAELLGGPTGE